MFVDAYNVKAWEGFDEKVWGGCEFLGEGGLDISGNLDYWYAMSDACSFDVIALAGECDGFGDFFRIAIDFATCNHCDIVVDRHGETIAAAFILVLGGDEKGGFVVLNAEICFLKLSDVGIGYWFWTGC